MNMFLMSKHNAENAMWLDDKRVVKMTLETAQLLSGAMHRNRMKRRAPYDPTHLEHPCTVWVADNLNNFFFAVDLFVELAEEYTFRYGKVHRCFEHYETFVDAGPVLQYPENGVAIPKCVPEEHKTMELHEAYRATMIDKWKNDTRQPKWSRREKPEWAAREQELWVD